MKEVPTELFVTVKEEENPTIFKKFKKMVGAPEMVLQRTVWLS